MRPPKGPSPLPVASIALRSLLQHGLVCRGTKGQIANPGYLPPLAAPARRPAQRGRLTVSTTRSPISLMLTFGRGQLPESLAERRERTSTATCAHESVTIGIPVDHRAARTRHPDAVALDAAVEIAAGTGAPGRMLGGRRRGSLLRPTRVHGVGEAERLTALGD